MATRSQITANRRNGRKGGVKTAKGKAITRLNAMKHGILSGEAIIRRGDVAESEQEYQLLRHALNEALKPSGLLECLLTDKLLLFLWRWRRAIRVECAEMERATIGHIERQRAASNPIFDLPAQLRHEQKRDRWDAALHRAISLAEHVEMLSFPLSDEWEAEMHLLMREGEPSLTEAVETLYFAQTCMKGHQIIPVGSPEHLAIQQKAQKIVEIVKALRQQLIDRDEHRYRATAQAALFTPSIERLQRYETTIYKQFMQVLHELERQQARRKGFDVPLAAAIDIVLSHENWVRLEKEATRSLAVPQHDALGIGKMALGRANLALK